MYFSGKSYFNTKIIRDIEVNKVDTKLSKPKSRIKKKLTRGKKAKKKYNLSRLKKELGNDMVIKLLLRLLEGRGGGQRGRPPIKESVKKPRQMKIRRGSGLPGKKAESSTAPKKKGNETEAQFFTRFEDWLYQNNPYFMYQQKQLKEDKDKAINELKTTIDKMRQGISEFEYKAPVEIPGKYQYSRPRFKKDLLAVMSKKKFDLRREWMREFQENYSELTPSDSEELLKIFYETDPNKRLQEAEEFFTKVRGNLVTRGKRGRPTYKLGESTKIKVGADPSQLSGLEEQLGKVEKTTDTKLSELIPVVSLPPRTGGPPQPQQLGRYLGEDIPSTDASSGEISSGGEEIKQFTAEPPSFFSGTTGVFEPPTPKGGRKKGTPKKQREQPISITKLGEGEERKPLGEIYGKPGWDIPQSSIIESPATTESPFDSGGSPDKDLAELDLDWLTQTKEFSEEGKGGKKKPNIKLQIVPEPEKTVPEPEPEERPPSLPPRETPSVSSDISVEELGLELLTGIKNRENPKLLKDLENTQTELEEIIQHKPPPFDPVYFETFNKDKQKEFNKRLLGLEKKEFDTFNETPYAKKLRLALASAAETRVILKTPVYSDDSRTLNENEISELKRLGEEEKKERLKDREEIQDITQSLQKQFLENFGKSFLEFQKEVRVERDIIGTTTTREQQLAAAEGISLKPKNIDSLLEKTEALSKILAEDLKLDPTVVFEIVKKGEKFGRAKKSIALVGKPQQSTYNYGWVKANYENAKAKEPLIKRKPGAQPKALPPEIETEDQLTAHNTKVAAEQAKIYSDMSEWAKDKGIDITPEEVGTQMNLKSSIPETTKFKAFITRKVKRQKSLEEKEAKKQAKVVKEPEPSTQPPPPPEDKWSELRENLSKQFPIATVEGVFVSTRMKLEQFEEEGKIEEYNKLAKQYGLPGKKPDKYDRMKKFIYSGGGDEVERLRDAKYNLNKLEAEGDVEGWIKIAHLFNMYNPYNPYPPFQYNPGRKLPPEEFEKKYNLEAPPSTPTKPPKLEPAPQPPKKTSTTTEINPLLSQPEPEPALVTGLLQSPPPPEPVTLQEQLDNALKKIADKYRIYNLPANKKDRTKEGKKAHKDYLKDWKGRRDRFKKELEKEKKKNPKPPVSILDQSFRVEQTAEERQAAFTEGEEIRKGIKAIDTAQPVPTAAAVQPGDLNKLIGELNKSLPNIPDQLPLKQVQSLAKKYELSFGLWRLADTTIKNQEKLGKTITRGQQNELDRLKSNAEKIKEALKPHTAVLAQQGGTGFATTIPGEKQRVLGTPPKPRESWAIQIGAEGKPLAPQPLSVEEGGTSSISLSSGSEGETSSSSGEIIYKKRPKPKPIEQVPFGESIEVGEEGELDEFYGGSLTGETLPEMTEAEVKAALDSIERPGGVVERDDY